MNSLFNNGIEKSEHPPREMLLLLVDGELQTKEAAYLEAHLEACWPCRVKTQKIQDAIADIIEFNDQALTPRLAPPQNWRNFERRLSQLAAASGKQSFSSRLFASLGRILPLSRLADSTLSLGRPALVRAALVLVLATVIVALALRFGREPTVSASQLLSNATEAQALQTRSPADPVVHQKLRVKRGDQTREQAVDWEIWDDAKHSRVRQFLAGGKQPVPAGTDAPASKNQNGDTAGDLVAELARVLAANHMDPARPLSAASYRSWHDTLRRPRDEIAKSKLSDGGAGLALHTVAAGPVNVGQIYDATFVVRAGDWLPTELRLGVASEGGGLNYELVQTASEVVSLAEVDPAIFTGRPAAAPAPVGGLKEGAKKESRPTPSSASNAQPLYPTPATAADIEVEILSLLHQAGADLGEQISVSRGADETVRVAGIVDTDARKQELLGVLSPFRDNRTVRLEIETVEEAVKGRSRQQSPSVVAGNLTVIEGSSVPADADLRRYFTARGVAPDGLDEEIRRFSARMIDHSRQAMQHAFAMRRVAERFDASQMETLSPAARSQLFAIIANHAAAFGRQARALREELEPVVGASGGAPPTITAVNSPADLVRAVRLLFELAKDCDATVGGAFSISAGRADPSAIRSERFWQSLRGAELLAGRIGESGRVLEPPK